jgi:hypothetical protein
MRLMIALSVCLFSSVCFAQTNAVGSGEAMLPGCKSFMKGGATDVIGAYQRGLCAGMLSTLFYVGQNLSPKYCSRAPSGSNVGQAMQIAIDFLEAHPERMKESFVDLAGEALNQAWPCKK